MKEIKKMWKIFEQKEKVEIGILLVMTIIGSFLELMGVSAIMPFVNVAMDPESVHTGNSLSKVYEMFHLNSVNSFLILIAITLVVIYFCKNMFLILLYNFQFRFTYQSQQRLECKLLSCYMSQNYTFHLSHNSAELQRNIIQDVTGFYLSVLAHLQLMTEGLVCGVLFLYLLYVDKTITLVLAIFMGIFLLVFRVLLRNKIAQIGVESRAASAMRVQWVQQSLNGIKEIKILGREKHFLGSYKENAVAYAERQRKYQLSMIVPRPIMETMCICSLLLVVAFKLSRGVSISYFVPTLSVFVIAAFRLLPSFSRMAGYVGAIAFQRSAVNRVYEDIQEAEELQRKNITRQHEDEKIDFTDSIHMKDICFRYPNTENDVLEKANVLIPKNKSIAFVGPSGAGKTTMADILLGVLEPQEGNILVDGKDIYDNLDAWHQKLGYIPQNIYLMDDTIRNNIAFGIPRDQIDDGRIRKALEEAQLLEFIESLDEGVNTYIGEAGIRLSGGQRQRIGIARALYMNPEVLILDEATSALDNDTEKAIMEAIDMLQGNKTLLIIAHRLTTIQNCDYIYEIRDGKATLKEKKEVLS